MTGLSCGGSVMWLWVTGGDLVISLTPYETNDGGRGG